MAISACLPDGKDPSEGADAGKANAAYYASTLGSIAIRIQDSILSDPSWFANSESSEFNLRAHNIDQPNGLGADIRSAVCFAGRDNNVTQLTWIDGKDETGHFSMKVLGNGAGKIATELRKSIGANQIGTYKGNGALAMADGTVAFIPTGCRSSELPIGTPVVVFDIDHPAAPIQEVSRTEYRTQSCGQDAAGRMMRGIMVQSRTITFKPNGTVAPNDPSAGWRTDDMGTCISPVDVAITNSENLAGGAAASLTDFAAVSLRDQLQAALANMDCKKVTVQSQATNRSGQSETRLKTIDTCANANVTGMAALSDEKRRDNEDTREIACTGVTDDMAAKLGDTLLTDAKITWESQDGFSNLITLTRKVATHALNENADDQSNKSLWMASGIDCAATETASLACNQVPGAPGTIPAPPMSNSPATTKDFTIPSSEKPYPMDDTWTARVLDKNYFTRARAIENGGLSLSRNVSAKSWDDAAAFKPKITGDPWTISQNQCTWDRLDMLPDCPTEFNAAKQGDWWPTGIVLDLGWLSEDNNALASAYWYDERAPEPAELSTDAFSYLMVRPWTADAPISDAQAKASASAWVFRYLRDKGEMPLRVYVYPDSQSPNYQGDYLRSWNTAAPNNIAFKDGTWVHNGKQYVYGFTLTKQPRNADIQTTLLNQHGVITRYKATMNGNSVGIGATEYVNPLYCGRSEEREFTVPFKHFACGGALIEEKAVTIKYTSYRRWRGTAPGVGSWSKSVGRFSTADEQLLRSPLFGLFDTPITADSMYLTASGDPLFPKDGLSYTDECAPDPEPVQCPPLKTPICGPNEIVITRPINGGFYAHDSNKCMENVCAHSCLSPTEVEARTPKSCPAGQHLLTGERDGNDCALPGRCVPDGSQGNGNWEDTARQGFDNCVANSNDPASCCTAPYWVTSLWGECPYKASTTTPPVVTPPSVQCSAVTQPTCTGFTHFVASPNDANGCTTVGTCVQNACPSLADVPQNQADCDRREWNMGPALWYVDGGVDANGCARGGSCHQETFSECAYRNGWNGIDVNVPPGCCNVYAPGTGGACNINGEYAPNY